MTSFSLRFRPPAACPQAPKFISSKACRHAHQAWYAFQERHVGTPEKTEVDHPGGLSQRTGWGVGSGEMVANSPDTIWHHKNEIQGALSELTTSPHASVWGYEGGTHQCAWVEMRKGEIVIERESWKIPLVSDSRGPIYPPLGMQT